MARLLAVDDPAAVSFERADSASPFVLVCDHAGQSIPRALGDLGLATHDLNRHIAWDIGALGVARELSARLDAPLIWQNYSRLVIDCNRPEHREDLVIKRSEATDIHANAELEPHAISARLDEIYLPYHAAITNLLDVRQRASMESILVSVHSFTPVYHGQPRPWQLGLLYGDDRRFADQLFASLEDGPDWTIGDNEPYRIDSKDHTIPEHAFKRQLRNILLEIRQDLIADSDDQRAWAEEIASLLQRAHARCGPGKS